LDVAIVFESIGYLVAMTIIAVFIKLFFNDVRLRGVPIARPKPPLALDPQIYAALRQDERNRECD
ncbi:MAG TPA: hypothetical protein VGW96_02960, partial [Candidatus Eremiobacteraceae bacterium]|nr:hypothetical protein [Candidatus Eremiobacteraceae bacterium]